MRAAEMKERPIYSSAPFVPEDSGDSRTAESEGLDSAGLPAPTQEPQNLSGFFPLDRFRIGGATLPQSRVRAKLRLLDGMILRNAERKLRANLDREVKNSTAYTMATIFNCIAESESDLLVDLELNRIGAPPGRW